MADLNIAFLWHMHQPNYRDPIRGYYSMPWVRLHATKAYYDMALLAAKYPEMWLTFNLVPSLLEQLEDYTAGGVDYELMLSRKDPSSLMPDEKEAILSRFFQANVDTMIRPLPRYIELMKYRGMTGTPYEIGQALNNFASQDYLDLQVLFNLSWFGFSAIEEDVDLKRLIRKGRLYSMEDRDLVLDKQRDIIARLPKLYTKLWKDAVIDVTASPFYHPILPLLCDTSSALEAIPGCLLPSGRFVHPEDAARQVDMALEYFKKKLKRVPDGMWPSEGSVSPEALEIIHNAGISWAATDEGILSSSVPGYRRDRDLYQPWNAHGVTMFFRDHTLSDQIGFVYARNPVQPAVDDFIGRLKAIAAQGGGSDRLVSVILDGENAWEYYPNSGKEFLETLYERILAEKGLHPVSFTNYLREHPPTKEISRIFPGSWINTNYDTWIGDQEEVDGWDALKNTRDLLVANEEKLPKKKRDEAWLEIFRAEGSDWFWWYGDDHSSPNDPEFDRLFRAHLERVYALLEMEVPGEITEPIIKNLSVRADAVPTGFVTPVIDGRATTFYEWLSAGWLPTAGPEGAMSGGESIVTDIYYGFDLNAMYIRLDLVNRDEPLNLTNWSLSVMVESEETYRIDVDLGSPGNYTILKKSRDKWVRRARREEVAVGKIIELGVSFADILVRTDDQIRFTVLLYEKGVEKERWPRAGQISFAVPDEDFQSLMWQL